MKILNRGNLVLIISFSALVMAFSALPVFANDSDQYVKDSDRVMEALARDLQKKAAVQLQQAMDAEILLSYENLLVQQSSAVTEQIILALSVEQEPVISIKSSEMMAKAVPVEKDVPVEEEEDCVRIQ